MPKTALRKERWTLSFDPELKSLVVRAARSRGIYPVALLEELVRERFNPFGHTDVADIAAYVAALRKRSRNRSGEEFLAEMGKWSRSRSS